MPSVAIVIPAYNEAPRVGEVLRSIPARLPGIDRILVIAVDDGSSDDTFRQANLPGVVVLRHRINLGVGAALRTGTEAALTLGADIVVHMDADGQHRPEDLSRLLAPLLAGKDAVAAVRSMRRPMPWLLVVGNRALSWAARILFAVSHPDTQCAYRAFWGRCAPTLLWESRDYAFASEMLVRGRRHIAWEQVPIETVYLDRYKGTGVADGVRILARMLKWRVAG